MAVTYETKFNLLPGIIENVNALSGRSVAIGVFDGEQAYIAGIHEYGCRIPVTEKMRKFLARKGLHLKATTTVIVIPERSFLRAGFDAKSAEIKAIVDRDIGELAAGRFTAEVLLDDVGMTARGLIQQYARDLSAPPNHPFTVEQKGSSNPLVNTGSMIAAIEYRKE